MDSWRRGWGRRGLIRRLNGLVTVNHEQNDERKDNENQNLNNPQPHGAWRVSCLPCSAQFPPSLWAASGCSHRPTARRDHYQRHRTAEADGGV